MSVPGKFFGIGVGPGDPELLTYKAVRILNTVDSIFLPATIARGQSFAGSIIETLGLEPARFRPVTLTMSRQRDADLQSYSRAADEILAELRMGKSAAWITEGDPLLYSTFLPVWAALQARAPLLEVEIVSGITSMQAAAAYAKIPITRLDEKAAFVPAAYGLGRLAELWAEFAVIFLLKVHTLFDQLLDEIGALSPPPQTFYVEKVGTPEQHMLCDLRMLRGKKLPYFSLVILRKEELKP